MEVEAAKTVEEINSVNLIKDTSTYLYKLWEGNNMFCCKGRLIAGPKHDLPAQVCVVFFMLTAGVLYYVLLAFKIAQEISIALPILW